MNSSGILSDRHPLHAVRATFEAHTSPDGLTLHQHRRLVHAAHRRAVVGHDVESPAIAHRPCAIHLEQLTGKQVGFFTTLGTAKFDNHVLAIIRIRWNQQHLQLVFELHQLGSSLLEFGLQRRTFVGRRRVEQLSRCFNIAGGRTIFANAFDEWPHLLVAPRSITQLALITQHFGAGKAGFELLEIRHDGVKFREHGVKVTPTRTKQVATTSRQAVAEWATRCEHQQQSAAVRAN